MRVRGAPRRFAASASALAVLAALGSSCGDGGDGSGASPGSGGSVADAAGDSSANSDAAWPDASASDATPTPDTTPTTTAHDPCATNPCWNAPTLGACGLKTVSENFSSGSYNVHRALILAPADVAITLSATRTAGNWSPRLILHDEQGVTVHDGADSFSTAELQVSAASTTSDTVAMTLKASKRMHLSVFLTGQSVMSSSFKDALPTDAQYSLQADVSCAPPPSLTVNGVKLDSEQELWVRYIAEHVVDKTPGTPAEQIDKSAYVTWWALKEGVLNVNNPLSYSNCSIPPDQHIGPLELCPNPKNAWQVGLSGVQATYNTLSATEQRAQTLFPGLAISEVLRDAAVTAGFGASTAQGKVIAGAADRLRLSWLLRHSPIGFAAQYAPVHSECFVAPTKSWCFGTGWSTSASYAPNQAGAQKSVNDLKGIFQSVKP